MSTTSNLADFGYRELDMAADLLKAYANGKGPDSFDTEGVTLMMNQNSGNVFLTNDACQVLMMNGDDLEEWYFTPYAGHEGFADDLKAEYEANPDDWHEDDVQFLIDCGIIDAPDED